MNGYIFYISANFNDDTVIQANKTNFYELFFFIFYFIFTSFNFIL